MELGDKVNFVIENTHDGDDLTPMHLSLMNAALYGYISDGCEKEIDHIYQAVKNGAYKRPPYFGLEYMDLDHQGNVYFKGQCVSCQPAHRQYTMAAERDIRLLQQQCLFWEGKGIPIDQILHETIKDSRYIEAFCSALKEKLDISAKDSAIMFSMVLTKHESFLMPGTPGYHDVIGSPEFIDICRLWNEDEPQCFSVLSYAYGDSAIRHDAFPEELECIYGCFDFLKSMECLQEISVEYHTIRQEEKQEDYGYYEDYEEDCEI